LVGWCMNTSQGTVTGRVEGNGDAILKMYVILNISVGGLTFGSGRKTWLSNIGSPKSKIERCEFTEGGAVERLGYSDFTVTDEPAPRK